MEGKGKRKELSEDSRVDSTLWALAELLAEIAAKAGKPAGEEIEHQPNNSTNTAGGATAG